MRNCYVRLRKRLNYDRDNAVALFIKFCKSSIVLFSRKTGRAAKVMLSPIVLSGVPSLNCIRTIKYVRIRPPMETKFAV